MATAETATARESAPTFLGWRGAAAAVGIAGVLALAQASQLVWATANSPRPIPWSAALAPNLTATLLWVLLVPVIFLVASRFPLSARAWRMHAMVHAVSALLVSGLYSTAYTVLMDRVIPESMQPWRGMRGPHPPRDFPPDRASREPTGDRTARAPGGERSARETPVERPGAFMERSAPPTFVERVRMQLMRAISVQILIYVVIAGVWHWLAQQHRLRERERQAQELGRQLADARLQALRMQLNPHFLFNTLNAIATLVHRAPKIADEMITCLSDFLRLTLHSGAAPENPLHVELEFARRYLDIEKLRFGDRLAIREEIAPECLRVPVPTLVLQPLLENAIRHGIEPLERRGEICLSVDRDGNQLVVKVSDTGPGLAPNGGARQGIGLANTRARLRELHGDAAALKLSDRPGGGLDVELRIPWHPGVPDSRR